MLDGIGKVFKIRVDKGFLQGFVFGPADEHQQQFDGQHIGDRKVRSLKQRHLQGEGQRPHAYMGQIGCCAAPPRRLRARQEQRFQRPAG